MPTKSETPAALCARASSPADLTGEWAALYVTRERYVKAAAFNLADHGIDYFLPMEPVWRRKPSGDRYLFARPIFDGYLFAHVEGDDAERHYALLNAREVAGAATLIRVGGDRPETRQINQRRLREALDELYCGWQRGDQVTRCALAPGTRAAVRGGPFRDFIGRVIRVDERAGVASLAIDLFGDEVPTEFQLDNLAVA